MSADAIRTDFEKTLDHVTSAFAKLVANAGKNKALTFPDLHKTTEGLFLSAWTSWEEFVRALLIFDLANDPEGVLRSEVKKDGFRVKRSALRLATLIADHPDEGKWIEWSSIDTVKQRADALLSPSHRFSILTGDELSGVRRLKKIRNAVAHKSDQAWEEFRELVQKQPYSLAPKSMQGLTAGRFLSAHSVGNQTVFLHSIGSFRSAAAVLVAAPPP